MLISTSKTVALCSFSNLINAADRAIMPIAVLQMAPEYKWDMHAQGWILSAFPIGYFSSQVGNLFFLYIISAIISKLDPIQFVCVDVWFLYRLLEVVFQRDSVVKMY